ncbi:MAG: hypothetical protein ACE5HS_00005, partial [bacterium]
GLVLFVAINSRVYGQQKHLDGSLNLTDSLSEDEWGDETYYAIEMLRLKRWIRGNTDKLKDPVLLKEIVRLKKEAENFAAKNDFNMAVIWLETIWALLKPDDDLQIGETSGQPEAFTTAVESSGKKFKWSRELSTGVDLWQLKFQIARDQDDTTTLDGLGNQGSGNPYTGIRLTFDYYSNSQSAIQGYTFFKYSRDYLLGEANLRITNPLGDNTQWRFENQFEGNSFYRDGDIKFIQNISTLTFQFKRIGPINIDIEDEFLFRRYDKENQTYPNYFDNTIRGYTRLDIGLGSYFGVDFRNIQRTYPKFQVNDYRENRIDFEWFQSFSEDARFSFEDELRFRDYTKAHLDTTTTFQDFFENYFRGEIRLPFSDFLGMDIDGSITKRDYKFINTRSLPDYLLWEIEPKLYFKLGSDWEIRPGFYYSRLKNQPFDNRLAPNALAASTSIAFEDYYKFGPTLAVEFFQIDGIMFNLQESFLLQRYPNANVRDIESFNLYTDRNINSILLFLTWNISNRWRLTVLANMDDDRSRKDESANSQNTIVGLEVNYIF